MSPKDVKRLERRAVHRYGTADAKGAPHAQERAVLDKAKAEDAAGGASTVPVKAGARKLLVPKTPVPNTPVSKAAITKTPVPKTPKSKVAVTKTQAARLVKALDGYKPLPATPDEMVGEDGTLRPLWQDFATAFASLAADDSEWAAKELAALRTKSPQTCKVALRQLHDSFACADFAANMAAAYRLNAPGRCHRFRC